MMELDSIYIRGEEAETAVAEADTEAAGGAGTATTSAPSRAATTAAAVALVARLRQTFPKAFAPDRPPFAVGIHREIAAALPDVDPAVLRQAMALWTRAPDYQLSLACRHRRVGLDGKATAERPTEDQSAWAHRLAARALHTPPHRLDARRQHFLAAWAQQARSAVAQSGKTVVLDGVDLRLALRLLSNHPEVQRKIAGGVTGIIVRPSLKGGAEIAIRAKDGSVEAFSASKCFNPVPVLPPWG